MSQDELFQGRPCACSDHVPTMEMPVVEPRVCVSDSAASTLGVFHLGVLVWDEPSALALLATGLQKRS